MRLIFTSSFVEIIRLIRSNSPMANGGPVFERSIFSVSNWLIGHLSWIIESESRDREIESLNVFTRSAKSWTMLTKQQQLVYDCKRLTCFIYYAQAKKLKHQRLNEQRANEGLQFQAKKSTWLCRQMCVSIHVWLDIKANCHSPLTSN